MAMKKQQFWFVVSLACTAWVAEENAARMLGESDALRLRACMEPIMTATDNCGLAMATQKSMADIVDKTCEGLKGATSLDDRADSRCA